MIPYGKQSIQQQDIDAVVDVLKSDFLTQGPQVPAFEQALADYCGAKHGVAVNSATSALHVACRALDVGEGDWLWTTPISFVASANCALYCGAQVDFVDIDPLSYNLSVEALSRKLVAAEKAARLPKVLIPVHLTGQSCDMAAIKQLSQRYGFSIIEDASHAVGGRYENKPIGDCRYADIVVFSFHPVKIITTAEGGMAVTNSKTLADKMALLRSHGISRDAELMQGESHGPWYYQQVDLGFNYRMTELQAALGLSQLSRIDEFVSARNKKAERYDRLFAGLPLALPVQSDEAYSSRHLYVVRLRLAELTRSRREIFEVLRARGVGVNLHYIPIYSHPYYQAMGFVAEDFPEAERYYSEAISIPLFQQMTETQQDEVITALIEELK